MVFMVAKQKSKIKSILIINLKPKKPKIEDKTAEISGDVFIIAVKSPTSFWKQN